LFWEKMVAAGQRRKEIVWHKGRTVNARYVDKNFQNKGGAKK
jgi:hypothetical protein